MYNDSYSDSYTSDNPLAVLKPTKEPRRYTLSEYLKKLENSEELYEYYDGTITKLPMARIPHNTIIMNIGTALNNAIEATNKPYRVMGGQQAVYIPKLNVSVFPDVVVVTENPVSYDNTDVLLTNPILIFETLSRSTKSYDRKEKFSMYKTLDSVKEYVLVEQNICHVESRFREEPDLWRDKTVTDISSSLYLKSIDCTIDLQRIYKHIAFKNLKK
ncbi:MAG: Uma2 family endonuclease [Saprospiraceae bacterium]|nr:Uma2 family endonuclease [Saprospiraceae bacterium]